MKDIDDKLQKIFNRAIARALGAMDIERASNEVKQAVKATFWDTMTEIKKEIETNERQERI